MQYDKEFKLQALELSDEIASRQLQINSASSITHLPTGVVSARLAAKKLSLAVVTK